MSKIQGWLTAHLWLALAASFCLGAIGGYWFANREHSTAECFLRHVRPGMTPELTNLVATACAAKYRR